MAPARRKAPKSSSSLQSTAIAPKHDESSESVQSTSTEPTPTGINRLTFDCLYLIFLRFPLETLLKIRPVSRTWNSTVIYICARKERLTLAVYHLPLYMRRIVNNPGINPPGPLGKSEFDLFWIDDLSRFVLDRTENSHETLHFSICQLTKQSTIGLARLFPSLVELRIHNDCLQLWQPYLSKIESLVGHFSSLSPNLSAFSFILSPNDASNYPPNGQMLNALYKIASNITTSRLPHLKQLDLCIAGELSRFKLKLPLYSAFAIDSEAKKYADTLAQLTRFSLGYDCPRWDTKCTLAKLGSSLVSLSLIDRDRSEPLIPMFDNVKFATSLTHLRLSLQHEASNHNFIRALYGRFQALKFVQLQIVGPTVPYFNDQWIQPLATLQHLSELRLHDFDVALDSSLSLPRVKKLTLCKGNLMVTDANAFSRTLATQFPNLEQLVIVGRPFCGYFTENNAARQVELQVRQHFAHVRSIVFDLTAPEWR